MKEPICIDVRSAFPAYRYRKTADHQPHRRISPWNLELICKYGSIYPHGGTRLQAYVEAHPRIAARLKALPGVQVWQQGDYELAVVFEAADAAPVLDLLKARKKPIMSPEQRKARADRFLNVVCGL